MANRLERGIVFCGRLLFASVFFAALLTTLQGAQASATHISPPGNVAMPNGIRQFFRQDCGHTGRSPSIVQWVAAQGSPATQVINVPYGTPSINLTLHFAGMICYPNSAVPEMRLRVMNAFANPPGTVGGIIGSTLAINWGGSYQTVGSYRQASDNFTYAPNGGFTQSGLYHITMDNRIINRFASGVYGCAAGGWSGVGWNFPGCNPDFPTFTIQVNITNPPTPTTISCAGTTPTTVAPNEPFTLRNGISSSGGTGPPVFYTIWTWWNTAGAAWPAGQANERIAAFAGSMPRGGSGTGVLPNAIHPQELRIANPGVYQGQYRAQVNDATNSPITCSFTIVVPEFPYHQVYGGDVRAGSGFLTSADVCPTDPAARIIGHNRNGSPNYTGAGSQLAAYVFDTLAFFATGQLRTNATAPRPLTFANVNPSRNNFGGTGYGGGLMDGQAVCAPNFYEDGSPDATNVLGSSTSANISEGIYRRTGNLNVTGGNLGLGTGARTIYVDGDVTISGNITYAGGNYNDIGHIPGFRLIVRGNIYVEPGVSQLDGIYVAQPRVDGTRGRFYTCGPGGAPPDAGEINGVCRSNKLTIYGAVAADLIKLTRSRGSVSQSANTALAPAQDAASSNAAEVIIMTPEAWLTSNFTGSGEFDSVTTLPPVL